MAASIGSISNAVTSLTQYAPRDLFLDFVKRPPFFKEVVKGQVSISINTLSHWQGNARAIMHLARLENKVP